MPDFLPESDDSLRNWSYAFSQRLNEAGGEYNVPPPDAAFYAQLQADFNDAYFKVNPPTNRSQVDTALKNAARKRLEQESRRLARIARASSATDAQLVSLGLKPARKPVRHVGVPRSRPRICILMTEGRRIFLHLSDSAHSTRRGKPRGIIGAAIYTCVSDHDPDNHAKWDITRLASRTRTILRFGPDVPPGSRIWICARWLNPRLQAGPESNIVSTYIGGGVSSIHEMRRAA